MPNPTRIWQKVLKIRKYRIIYNNKFYIKMWKSETKNLRKNKISEFSISNQNSSIRFSTISNKIKHARRINIQPTNQLNYIKPIYESIKLKSTAINNQIIWWLTKPRLNRTNQTINPLIHPKTSTNIRSPKSWFWPKQHLSIPNPAGWCCLHLAKVRIRLCLRL